MSEQEQRFNRDMALAIQLSIQETEQAPLSGTVESLALAFYETMVALPEGGMRNILDELCTLLTTRSVGGILWCSRKVLEYCVAQLYTAQTGREPRGENLRSMLDVVSTSMSTEMRHSHQSMDFIRTIGNAATHGVATDNVSVADVELALVNLKRIVEYTISKTAAPTTSTTGAPSTSNNNATSLADELSCTVCFEIMADPRTTGCGHSFCADCLQAVLASQPSPSCPMCRAQLATALPAPNVLLRELIDTIRKGGFQLAAPSHSPARAGPSSRAFSNNDSAAQPFAPSAAASLTRPGDWACLACGVNNFAMRGACFRCNTPRRTSSGAQLAPAPTVAAAAAAPAVIYPSPVVGLPAVMPGDWVCNGCRVNNFASRSVCFKCQTPRNTPAPSTTAVAPAPTLAPAAAAPIDVNAPRVGDWTCAFCSRSNFASRTACFMCKAAKTTIAATATTTTTASPSAGAAAPQRREDWYCSDCGNKNFASRTECHMCKKWRPGYHGEGSLRGGAPASRAGDWSCRGCGNSNFASRTLCHRCNMQR